MGSAELEKQIQRVKHVAATLKVYARMGGLECVLVHGPAVALINIRIGLAQKDLASGDLDRIEKAIQELDKIGIDWRF